ncbi:MAG TPA: extracellular solute-binding protein [Hyphomicrobiaceae bacterium]|nr:extracellular solute-binding protein [Hyphomicrobiaceae bacterium]
MARYLSLALAPMGLWLLLLAPVATASEVPEKHHALSLIGEPAYDPEFSHFNWVNPNAPKGGRVRMMEFGSFDSLNGFTSKGDVPSGIGLIYDTLMVGSPDEASTEYGLIAEWVSFPDDFSSATFQIRSGARFHDGTPITPEDVIFSMEAVKKVNPNRARYYKNVVKAEKVADNQVKFTFNVTGNRELPLIVGQLTVLPKHFWEGKAGNGEPRDLAKTTLEIPLGSGPYRVKAIDPGRSITFERVKDWWAKDLAVAQGQWNFDEIKYVFFRDWLPGFESFKAGELDFWEENSAKNWATRYDFDAIKRGLVLKEKIPVKRVAPMQAFAFNIRRPQLKDPRVRRAFNLALNFEQMNKTLLYEQYQRVNSYFDNSELMATGLPQGRELELLNEVKDKVPPEVFTAEWKNPVNTGPDEDGRKNLAKAAKLLAEAGYRVKNGVLTNASGLQLKVEFLNRQPDFERLILPYITSLERLGIKATLRTVDSAQWISRIRKREFDITTITFPQSESPGNEQRSFWSSDAADKEGTFNFIGIKNPAIDHLIDKIILAKDRGELVAATRALDRVLLWNHYVVPQWHGPFERIAMWNVFGRPDKLPSRSPAFLRTWWWDAEKAKQAAAAQ